MSAVPSRTVNSRGPARWLWGNSVDSVLVDQFLTALAAPCDRRAALLRFLIRQGPPPSRSAHRACGLPSQLDPEVDKINLWWTLPGRGSVKSYQWLILKRVAGNWNPVFDTEEVLSGGRRKVTHYSVVRTNRAGVRMSVRYYVAVFFVAIGFAGSLLIAEPVELIVVGTVHQEQPAYTVDSLQRILERVKPHVVLLEGDPSCLDEDFQLHENCRGGLEKKAVLAYSAKHDVQLRNCDMDSLGHVMQRLRVIERQQSVSAAVNLLYSEGRISPETRARVLRIMDNRRTAALITSPRQINSPLGDSIAKWYNVLSDSVGTAPELSESVRADAHAFSSHWRKRNEAIVAKAVYWAKQFPGKRLVMLFGYSHRWAIRQGLLGRDEILLKEYWE